MRPKRGACRRCFLPPPAGRLHAALGGQEGVEFTRQARGIAEAWGGTWESLGGYNHFTILDRTGRPRVGDWCGKALDLLA